MLTKSQIDRRNRKMRQHKAELSKLRIELEYTPPGYRNAVRRKIERLLNAIYQIREELESNNAINTRES